MSDDWPSLVTGASFSPFTLSHSAFYALTNTPANTDLALKVASEYLLIKVSCNTMLRSSPDVENQGSNAGQCRISLCIIRHMFMLCIQSGTRRRESPQGLIYIICIISRIFGPKTTNRISTVRSEAEIYDENLVDSLKGNTGSMVFLVRGDEYGRFHFALTLRRLRSPCRTLCSLPSSQHLSSKYTGYSSPVIIRTPQVVPQGAPFTSMVRTPQIVPQGMPFASMSCCFSASS